MNWLTRLSHRTYLYRSIVALLVGIAVLFVPYDTMNTLVMLIGVFVLLAGLGTAFGVYRAKHNLFLSFGGTASIVSIVVGLLLLLRPAFFVQAMVVIMGIVLTIIGLVQVINVSQLKKYVSKSSFYLVGSLITLCIGLSFLVFPKTVQSFIGVLIGITLIIYALNELGLGYRTRKQFSDQAEIEDATFEEVE